MTEQEKELALLLNSFIPTHREKWLDEELISAARALIQTYPQILAEKVEFIEANVGFDTSIVAKIKIPLKWIDKNIEVFIREVKE